VLRPHRRTFRRTLNRDGEERHLGLARNSLRQQRLARSGRANQQHAFRHPAAESAVIGGAFQKIHDLAKFVLGFVHTGDVRKGDPGIGLDVNLGLALADLHQPAAEAALCDALADVPPDTNEQQHRHDP